MSNTTVIKDSKVKDQIKYKLSNLQVITFPQGKKNVYKVATKEYDLIADCPHKFDAELIVKCLVSHYKLIEALKSAKDVLVMASLIDNSNTCEKEADNILKLLSSIEKENNL